MCTQFTDFTPDPSLMEYVYVLYLYVVSVPTIKSSSIVAQGDAAAGTWDPVVSGYQLPKAKLRKDLLYLSLLQNLR